MQYQSVVLIDVAVQVAGDLSGEQCDLLGRIGPALTDVRHRAELAAAANRVFSVDVAGRLAHRRHVTPSFVASNAAAPQQTDMGRAGSSTGTAGRRCRGW